MAGIEAPAPKPMRKIVLLTAFILSTPQLYSQSEAEVYRVYTEHPRLFLRPARLKLLKRERERQSMRWRQFETLLATKGPLPEPGFALALYYAISGDVSSGKRAVEWALSPAATDVRQLAFVYDWCQDPLGESQAKVLAAKIQKLVAAIPANAPLPQQRNRALAAIAIAEENQSTAENVLTSVAAKWWKSEMAPKLNSGANLDPGAELEALLELLHAVRDNLNIDLRPVAPDYFKALPSYQVTCNYPAPFPATENEYRIPVFPGSGEPDLNRAALARVAGLATVAYDTNALENQFLQGWLIQDRFMLRGAFGAPYEFLWANPYQPGLSYAHLPLIFHDARSGSLILRSDWDEDAVWFALVDGQAQLFRDGKITVLNRNLASSKTELLSIGKASVVQARQPQQFKADGEQIFIIGGKPRVKYDVEVDDQELTERESDAAGTVFLQFTDDQNPGVRMKESNRGRK